MNFFDIILHKFKKIKDYKIKKFNNKILLIKLIIKIYN